MMRLVFLLFAEERALLPLGEALYAESYAVSTLRDALDADAVRLGDEPLERRATAWRRLLATFAAIYGRIAAHDRLRIPAYGGRLFDPARFAFLGRARIDDLTVRAVLTALQTVTLGGEARRLSFLTLDVEQIGHVYEGLLDHGVKRVDDVHLGFDGKSGAESEIALAEVEAVAAKGRAALLTFFAEKLVRSEKSVAKLLDRGEKLAVGGADGAETRRGVMQACESDEALVRRVLPYAPLLRSDLHGLPTVYAANGLLMTKTRARRDSGTEYTPRELAEEIVLYALRPLCYAPGPADGAPESAWRVKSSAELLALKICDPACGSGAFLVATCRYLAERVAEAWQHEGRTCDDDPVREAQRLIAERCLYGVDRDPMAVEMAKLSLWLLTFARDRPFGFLDHAVREGDSLLGITSLDQLRHLHLDPERGRSLHEGSLFDATARLDTLVEEAVALRVRLEDRPLLDIADAREKARLDARARVRTYEACVLADALVGTAFAKYDRPQRERDASVLALARDASRALAFRDEHEVDATAAFASIERQAGANLNHGKPTDAPLRRPFHWALEFPEVFRAGGRFDCVVGNPPFLGGKFITGRFGTDYRALLVESIANGRRGHADLVAYFFLRAATIGHRFEFIATNTIAQGDTREVALDDLTSDVRNWSIVRAERSRPWPGAAAIQVAEVWCAHESKAEKHTLDGAATPGITPGLVPPGRAPGNPHRLVANACIAFQGSVVLGMGFTMSPEEAHALIERDPQNAEVLSSYIGAGDVCDEPAVCSTRRIINFGTMSEDEARIFGSSEDQVGGLRSSPPN